MQENDDDENLIVWLESEEIKQSCKDLKQSQIVECESCQL